MVKRKSSKSDTLDNFFTTDPGEPAKMTIKSNGHHPCFKGHPSLKLPGTDFVIYGGSCINPIVHDADIYIGFDYGMSVREGFYPWLKNPREQFLYRIDDMNPPSDTPSFRDLLGYTLEKLAEGRKIHCGCIGGHGRTGTFLAALVASCGEPRAIEYVRENYCPSAVETNGQIEFLRKNFGVEVAKPSKAFVPIHTPIGKPVDTTQTIEAISGLSIWD